MGRARRYDESPAARYCRSGRASVTLLIATVTLVAGGAVGYWLPKRFGATPSPAGTTGASGTSASADEQWYTCGMHPNVLQQGPGDCPICQMKLTPRNQDSHEGDDTGDNTERKVLYWRAPMDPNFVSDTPGQSPMGMDLVPVYADESESPSGHTIRIDPVTIQNMGIRTTTVHRGSLAKIIRTVGRIDYDEQLVTFIDTKFDGWIEKLHVAETGQRVAKGQPLFDVYSPALYAAQVEYLAAVRGLPRLEGSTFAPAREEAVKLIEAATTKLKYLDVSDQQIEQLRTTQTVEKALTFHSPAGGIVTEKMALQGMHVEPGMRLYTIADLSRVWVYVDIYEYQLPWIHVGQPATITLPYVPGKAFVGKVVYVYPYLEEQTRVIKVRLEFENPTMELKPGMFTNVVLEAELHRDALLIPREAYIDSGTRKVAFVDHGNGRFSPRDIQVGVESENGLVEVLFGLDEGEVVVTSGQFMLDGESKLKEAVAKMMKAQRAETTKRPPEDAPAVTTVSVDGIPQDARYACPMDEHPDAEDPARKGPVFSAEPGRCPECGMTLKPLDKLEWIRLRRAAHGAEVAYTCPDHQHVFAEQPGTCPRCGKDLTSFKVIYTCPDPQHANVISTAGGNCPRCGKGLAAVRGLWLDEAMSDGNVPPDPGVADEALYRCPVHPLVHSQEEGSCTICAAALEHTTQAALAKAIVTEVPPTAIDEPYVCPMHADTVRSKTPGGCATCGMQLVLESSLQRPTTARGHVAMQMDYILEHYLEIQKLLASDRNTGVAANALGLVSASEALAKHAERADAKIAPSVTTAANALKAASLKVTGNLDSDRVTFVELSAAVRALVDLIRPDQQRWPKLYIYHCPMSKGDWLQTSEAKANPYYGFKMLKCGELKGVK